MFPSPDNGATGVFRAATECGCGPTKGSESPLATEGKTEGGAKTIEAEISLLGLCRAGVMSV